MLAMRLLISAGFDAHMRDPLADLMLETEDFGWLTRQLRTLAQRHAGGRPDARQGPDGLSDDDADDEKNKIGRLQRRRETLQEKTEGIHWRFRLDAEIAGRQTDVEPPDKDRVDQCRRRSRRSE